MNANEKQQFLAHWAKVRRRGIALYLLVTALSWGTVSAVLLRFVAVLLEQEITADNFRAAYLSRDFLGFWVWCLLAGLLLGLLFWFFYRRQYRVLSKEC